MPIYLILVDVDYHQEVAHVTTDREYAYTLFNKIPWNDMPELQEWTNSDDYSKIREVYFDRIETRFYILTLTGKLGPYKLEEQQNV